MKTPLDTSIDTTPGAFYTAKIDELLAMCEAQTAALYIALEFINTVGEWGQPYSTEAATASEAISNKLGEVTKV